jgi:predicted nucleic acid-binding protein
MNDEPSACFVDSNVWLYILLPGQDGDKATIAKELVLRQSANIIVNTQIINEVPIVSI